MHLHMYFPIFNTKVVFFSRFRSSVSGATMHNSLLGLLTVRAGRCWLVKDFASKKVIVL